MIFNYDPEFIKPEIRAGWEVSEETKKVWWIQIDLLKQFMSICDKYHLRWYLAGGALIGVIRHHGFIPWDDDIDVQMPREDFNKFLKIYKKEVKYPYYLQTTITDYDCYQNWISLRNCETTGARRSCLSTRQNNGIAIDILPFDGVESNLLLYKIRRFPLRCVSVMCNTYVNEFNKSKKAVLLRKFLRKFNLDYKKIYRWLERQNSKHPWSRHQYVSHTLIADPIAKDIRRVIYPKTDYDDVVYMPFENITIPVPIGYDDILRIEYGDYMKFPPIEKRKAKHDMVFAPDVPYKEFCSKNYGVKYDKEEK